MNVKELKEALAVYPDDMEVEILSVFTPNMIKIQKDYYSIESIGLNKTHSCITLLESYYPIRTEVEK